MDAELNSLALCLSLCRLTDAQCLVTIRQRLTRFFIYILRRFSVLDTGHSCEVAHLDTVHYKALNRIRFTSNLSLDLLKPH